MNNKPSSYKDWTEELPSRLEGHEATPPEGLWEGIAESVPALGGKKPRRIIPLWGWYAAASLAAAAVLLAVFLWPVSPDLTPAASDMASLRESSPEPDAAEADSVIPEVEEIPAVSIVPSEPSARKALLAESRTVTPPSAFPLYEDAVLAEPEMETEPAEQQTPAISPADASVQEEAASPLPDRSDKMVAEEKTREDNGDAARTTGQDRSISVNEDIVSPHTTPGDVPILKARSGDRVRLGISTGQFLADNSIRTTNGFGLPGPAPRMSAPGSGLTPSMVTRNQPSTTDTRHAIPMRFALTLQIGLTPRWSLETGLAATVLDSRFTTTSGATTQVENRRSTYLGVPLSLHYRIWDWKPLSVYGAFGGEYDVAARTRTSRTTSSGDVVLDAENDQALVKDHSWSLNGSVGIQYELWSKGLFFIQPGISWHFPRDDGAPETAFTARPLTPEMTFGLRIRL